jgi:16S rRNA (uracil1498-N3)-methyltransferase
MRPHRTYHPILEPIIQIMGIEANHLRVLRAKIGNSLTVFNGAGFEANGIILEVTDLQITVQLEPATPSNLEPPQPITLAIALLKADKLSDVVRAATELGISSIQLLITQHSEVKEIGTQKLERLRRIATEAAKQCQRNVIPNILEPIRLQDLSAPAIVAHPHSSLLPREAMTWDAPFTIISGPEGGFSSSEIALLENKGIVRVSLGKRILRAETAALALISSLTAAEGY